MTFLTESRKNNSSEDINSKFQKIEGPILAEDSNKPLFTDKPS